MQVNEILPSYTQTQGVVCILITGYLLYNCEDAPAAAGSWRLWGRRDSCDAEPAGCLFTQHLCAALCLCRHPLHALPDSLGEWSSGVQAACQTSLGRFSNLRVLPSLCQRPRSCGRPQLSNHSQLLPVPNRLQVSFFASLTWASLIILLTAFIYPNQTVGLFTTLLWAGATPVVCRLLSVRRLNEHRPWLAPPSACIAGSRRPWLQAAQGFDR